MLASITYNKKLRPGNSSRAKTERDERAGKQCADLDKKNNDERVERIARKRERGQRLRIIVPAQRLREPVRWKRKNQFARCQRCRDRPHERNENDDRAHPQHDPPQRIRQIFRPQETRERNRPPAARHNQFALAHALFPCNVSAQSQLREGKKRDDDEQNPRQRRRIAQFELTETRAEIDTARKTAANYPAPPYPEYLT